MFSNNKMLPPYSPKPGARQDRARAHRRRRIARGQTGLAPLRGPERDSPARPSASAEPREQKRLPTARKKTNVGEIREWESRSVGVCGGGGGGGGVQVTQ